MTIEFFSRRDINATRKAHTCHACERPIAKGQPATHCAGKAEGDFYNAYYHQDCREAEVTWSAACSDEHEPLWYLYEQREDVTYFPGSLEFVENMRTAWPAVLNRLEEREQARASANAKPVKIRDAVEEMAGSGRTAMSCQDIVDHATERCGFPAAATAVSRIMGELGWEKFRFQGKVHFRKPDQSMAGK